MGVFLFAKVYLWAMTNLKRKIGLGIAIVIIVIQFIPSNLHVEETFSDNNIIHSSSISEEVKNILVENCFDCHSNQLRKPWYYRVRPITFWLNHHVEEAREHLNFDEWLVMDLKEQIDNSEECAEELEEGEMPLKSYQIMHPKMSSADRALLVKWFEAKH
jgi:hypothetical protein